MSSLFETHLITIEANGLSFKPGTRQPVGGYTLVAEHCPCHIGRTGATGSVLKLHITKAHLDTLKEQLKRGFRITDEDTKTQYNLTENPIWAGGLKHHIECTLEEVK